MLGLPSYITVWKIIKFLSYEKCKLNAKTRGALLLWGPAILLH